MNLTEKEPLGMFRDWILMNSKDVWGWITGDERAVLSAVSRVIVVNIIL
jgi:hypothetical protein